MEYVCLRFMKKAIFCFILSHVPLPFSAEIQFLFQWYHAFKHDRSYKKIIYITHRKSFTKKRHQDVFWGLSTCVEQCIKHISCTLLWGFTYLLEVHIALIQNCMYHQIRTTGMEQKWQILYSSSKLITLFVYPSLIQCVRL
jgi:hypothetical protein